MKSFNHAREIYLEHVTTITDGGRHKRYGVLYHVLNAMPLETIRLESKTLSRDTEHTH